MQSHVLLMFILFVGQQGHEEIEFFYISIPLRYLQPCGCWLAVVAGWTASTIFQCAGSSFDDVKRRFWSEGLIDPGDCSQIFSSCIVFLNYEFSSLQTLDVVKVIDSLARQFCSALEVFSRVLILWGFQSFCKHLIHSFKFFFCLKYLVVSIFYTEC